MQLGEVVHAGLDVAHVTAGGEVGGEGHDLAHTGRARIQIHHAVLVFGFDEIRPRLRHVLDELGVDDERHRQGMDGEPLAVRVAEHRREPLEVDRLERRDDVLRHRVEG